MARANLNYNGQQSCKKMKLLYGQTVDDDDLFSDDYWTNEG
jgi:hypothetical protein